MPVLVPRSRQWLARKPPSMQAKMRSFASSPLHKSSPSPPTCAVWKGQKRWPRPTSPASVIWTFSLLTPVLLVPLKNVRFAEYPSLKVFSIHPGTVKTDMYDEAGISIPINSTVELAASTTQYLTSGKADYLSGRYIYAQWDLGKVERDSKEKIIAQNGLVSELSIPA